MRAGERTWRTRTLVNATGTWTQPFVPHYPGIETFAGEQLHTHAYPGPEHFAGRRVLVVGGGASAVQFLGELAPVADTLWVTRREPVWRTDDFDPEAGLAAVTLVADRVRRGLPPASVVGVTGLALRPQEREAERLGRLPPATDVRPDRADRGALGRPVRASSGSTRSCGPPASARPSATSPRCGCARRAGGIQLDVGGAVQSAVTAVRDPRVQLVGYGPSASTIGANRAGRAAAIAVAAAPGRRPTT